MNVLYWYCFDFVVLVLYHIPHNTMNTTIRWSLFCFSIIVSPRRDLIDVDKRCKKVSEQEYKQKQLKHKQLKMYCP